MNNSDRVRAIVGVSIGVLAGLMPTLLPAVGDQSPPVGTQSPPCGATAVDPLPVSGTASATEPSSLAFSVSCGNDPAETFTVRPNGTRLLHLGQGDYPEWSPSGTQIAVGGARKDSAAQNLHVMDANGANGSLLTTGPFNDYHPSWSPDGTRIAFASDRAAQYLSEIYVVDVRTRVITRVTTDSCQSGQGTTYCLTASDSPRWSPDGQQILYRRFTTLCCGTIDAINVDGTGRRELFGFNGIFTGAAWSPTGRQIVYGDVLGLHIVNADGSGVQDVPNTRNCPTADSCFLLGDPS
ncbi:MAG: TolB family protein, partial [bacterium]